MTVQTQPGSQVRKGRPRDERLDGQISAAAIAVLADGGFDRFSVEEVACRAGVAKTTIYRRFSCRSELMAAALDRLAEDPVPDLAPGTARQQLTTILDSIRRSTPDSPRGRILMHAMASDDPRLAEVVYARVVTPRSDLLRRVIVAGMASGELRSDLDVDAVIPTLVGPMMYLGLWRMRDTVQRVSVDDVLDLIMNGLTRASDS
jgi:AcrR family transcriptional regulator